MTKLKMGICHYPVTTLLLDDNHAFLKDVELNLSIKQIPCMSYENPKQALNFINDTYHADPFTNRCVHFPEDRDIDSFMCHLDFRKIHHEIYNPIRFSQIGILIADYIMPMLSGLTFLQQVEEVFSQKMLLTGEASQSLVIDAFNQGIIEKFIQKGESDISTLLVQGIKDLQKKYFLKLSEHALNKATSELYNQAPVCLTDAVFINFFQTLCEKDHIVEYYLLDEHGSFLLLDAEANPKWLIVKSEKDMKNIIEFAADQSPSQKIMEDLLQRQVVPYFHTEEDWKVSYNDARCSHYLHPAQTLEGEKAVYYYAYLPYSDTYNLNRHKILSFANYFKSI